MTLLPWPPKASEIKEILTPIDERLLNCSEDFIRLQVKKPIENMITQKVKYAIDSPQSTWFNIYSIFNANQQLNEACNKLWATAELTNVTSRRVFNKNYEPIGKEFIGSFILGTTLPTLYYSQLSTIVSVLSAFGCVPVRVNSKRYYLLRSKDGWTIQPRNEYMSKNLGVNADSWHDVILRTYKSLKSKGIRMQDMNIERTFKLKSIRNEMHYEVLGDLKMWRVYDNRNTYFRFSSLVFKSIELAIKNLAYIKKVTTNCDTRFANLNENFKRLNG